MSGLTLHHLQRSQSERILWLLEELNVPYSLVLHKRDPLLAPPSLKALHELGTAPVITDNGLTLSESMAVATYIINKHGGEAGQHVIVEPESPDYSDYLFILYFVVCSLQPAGSGVMLSYFDETLGDESPARAFPKARFLKYLKFTEKWLGEKNRTYLAGERFTLADIMALWVFTTSRTFIPYSLEPYPNILAYVQRIVKREAYQRAMDKGDHGLPILSGAEPGEKKAYF